MKRGLFLILTLSTFLVFGCADSDDEAPSALMPIQVTCGGIETTRGSAYTKDSLENLSTIAMYAYWQGFTTSIIYIPKTELEYKNNSWTDGNTYYWPLGAITLVSYSPATSSCITDLDTENHTVKFTVSHKVSEQIDLLTCNKRSSGNVEKNGKDIKFTYRHALARIDIIVKNNTSAELSNVGVDVSGKFTTQGIKGLEDYAKWTSVVSPTDTVSYTPTLTAKTIASGGSVENASNNSIMVIPNGNVDITFALHYEGIESPQLSTVNKVNLKQGCSYVFTLNVNGSEDGDDTETPDASASVPATRAVAPLEVTTCVEPWK
jgi:hypothetical protein